MDTEHRHELKENDLAVFLSNFGEWWGKYGRHALILILIVVAVILFMRFTKSRSELRHESDWSRLATTTSPDVFYRLAEEMTDPAAAALANIRGAAAYNDRVTHPSLVATPDESGGTAGTDADATPDTTGVNSTDKDAVFLDRAERMLKRVLEDERVPELYKLNALMVLAAVKENRGDFDAARQTYEELASRAKNVGQTALQDQAQLQSQMVDRLRTPIVFGPEPEPVTGVKFDTPPVTAEQPSPANGDAAITLPGSTLVDEDGP